MSVWSPGGCQLPAGVWKSTQRPEKVASTPGSCSGHRRGGVGGGRPPQTTGPQNTSWMAPWGHPVRLPWLQVRKPGSREGSDFHRVTQQGRGEVSASWSPGQAHRCPFPLKGGDLFMSLCDLFRWLKDQLFWNVTHLGDAHQGGFPPLASPDTCLWTWSQVCPMSALKTAAASLLWTLCTLDGGWGWAGRRGHGVWRVSCSGWHAWKYAEP